MRYLMLIPLAFTGLSAFADVTVTEVNPKPAAENRLTICYKDNNTTAADFVHAVNKVGKTVEITAMPLHELMTNAKTDAEAQRLIATKEYRIKPLFAAAAALKVLINQTGGEVTTPSGKVRPLDENYRMTILNLIAEFGVTIDPTIDSPACIRFFPNAPVELDTASTQTLQDVYDSNLKIFANRLAPQPSSSSGATVIGESTNVAPIKR